MRRVLSGLTALSLVVSLAACDPDSDRPESSRTTLHAAPEIEIRTPVQYGMPDCENTDGTYYPCVSTDGNAWRVVESNPPYQALNLTQCVHRDGSDSVFPCVWKNQDVYGNWLVWVQGERWGQ